jgi:hypothetical protein
MSKNCVFLWEFSIESQDEICRRSENLSRQSHGFVIHRWYNSERDRTDMDLRNNTAVDMAHKVSGKEIGGVRVQKKCLHARLNLAPLGQWSIW